MLSLLLALFIPSARGLEIPKGLSESDRITVVQTLGLGTAPKMLTDPFPLGGYSGFEIGYSVEFVNIQNVNRLGCAPGSSPGGTPCPNTRTPDEDEFRISRISIGKGLYHDIDLFFSFAPPVGGTDISDYGGSVRWTFYQAEFLPITFSAILHANRMNVQDEFVDLNLGAEVIAGISVDNFSIYAGGGELWSRGSFMVQGSPDPGTGTVSPGDPAANSSNVVTQNIQQLHAVIGVSVQYQNLFGAAEIDRYLDSVYSLKLGTRF